VEQGSSVLGGPTLGVASAAREQFFVGPLLNYPSVRHHRDAVRNTRGAETVGDEKGGAASGQFAKADEPVSFVPGVHCAGGLIENKDGCGPEEGAGQGQTLPFANAEVGTTGEPAAEYVIVAERQLGGDGIDSGCLRSSRHGGGGSVIVFADSGRDVACHRCIVLGRFLKENRNLPAEFIDIEVGKLDAVQLNHALLRIVESAKKFDESALARAVLADYGDDRSGGYVDREVFKRCPGAVWIVKSDIPEGNSSCRRRRKGDGARRTDNLRLQLQEFKQAFEVEAVAIDLADVAEERPGESGALLKCLIKESDIAGSGLSSHGSGGHPQEGQAADYKGRHASRELGEALGTGEADALSGKAATKLVEAGAEVRSESEQPQFGCVTAAAEYVVVMVRAPFLRSGADPPVVVADCIMENHIEGWQGAGNQGDGEPESEGSENAGHGDQRDAALSEAAEVFDQREGDRRGFVSGAVQMVEEIRVFVEAEVGGSGFLLDEAANVITDKFGLRGADPGFEPAERLDGEKNGGHQHGIDKGGTKCSTLAHDGEDRIYQRPGQVDLCNGEDAADEEENGPGDGPAAGRGPDESERLREQRGLAGGAFQARGNVAGEAGSCVCFVFNDPIAWHLADTGLADLAFDSVLSSSDVLASISGVIVRLDFVFLQHLVGFDGEHLFLRRRRMTSVRPWLEIRAAVSLERVHLFDCPSSCRGALAGEGESLLCARQLSKRKNCFE
jgi:hypothetical protein